MVSAHACEPSNCLARANQPCMRMQLTVLPLPRKPVSTVTGIFSGLASLTPPLGVACFLAAFFSFAMACVVRRLEGWDLVCLSACARVCV